MREYAAFLDWANMLPPNSATADTDALLTWTLGGNRSQSGATEPSSADQILARLESELPQGAEGQSHTAWAISRAAEGGHVSVVEVCVLSV